MIVSLSVVASTTNGQPLKLVETDDVTMLADQVYASYDSRTMHLDLFVPNAGTKPRPALVVVHGGGWVKGDKTKFHAMAQALALRGYVTAAIEYRLAGEAKYPAAIHDCRAAVRWLRANAEKYAIDPNRIGAVGGSAGGHLVGLMAAAPQTERFEGSGGNPDQSSGIQAAIVLAGPWELASGPVAEKSRQQPQQSYSNQWLGKSVDEALELYREASPLTHLSKDTPPVLFLTGELDFPERNRAARARLAEFGIETGIVVYKDGKHGCWNRGPWFDVMVDDMDAFFAKTLDHLAAGQTRPLVKTSWGEIRAAADHLELIVDRRPAEPAIAIPRFNNPIGKVYVQGDASKAALRVAPFPDRWLIALPPGGDAADATPLTILVETVDRPYLPKIPRIVSGTSEHITLAAHDAVTVGKMLRYEPQPHKNTVGYWTNPADTCHWLFYADEPGDFNVEVLQGCGKGHGGSEVSVIVGSETLKFVVEDTGHFQNFKRREIGSVNLPSAGLYELAIKPVTKASVAVMDVRQVRLVRPKQ